MHKHIQDKEKADELSFKIKKAVEELRETLMLLSMASLYMFLSPKWYEKQMVYNFTFNRKIDKHIRESQKAIIKEIKANNELVRPNQRRELEKFVNVETVRLGTIVKQEHLRDIAIAKPQIDLHNESASEMYEQLNKVFNARPNGNYVNVTYKNGKTYKFENYMEMSIRTQIQSEISHKMLEDGFATGGMFYICSFYGDCAKDHAEYQGRIYYDERWESVCPDNVKEQVGNYIRGTKMLSMQEVLDKPPYLTTRPNCRHYFTEISIDEVLNIKSMKDLENTLKDRDMAYNGSYSSEKYEALEQQRYNERNLRKYKEERDMAQVRLDNLPSDATQEQIIQAKNELNNAKHNVSEWQKKQRELINNNDHLQRNYERENPKGNLPKLSR